MEIKANLGKTIGWSHRILGNEILSKIVEEQPKQNMYAGEVAIGDVTHWELDGEGNLNCAVALKDENDPNATPQQRNMIKMNKIAITQGLSLGVEIGGHVLRSHEEDGVTVIDEFNATHVAIVPKHLKPIGENNDS